MSCAQTDSSSPVWQHHALVVLVERLSRDEADEPGLRAVRERQRLGQVDEGVLAHGAVGRGAIVQRTFHAPERETGEIRE